MPSTNPSLLRLYNATVVRDNRAILDSISLDIAQGEHTAILGPNGSGKSTLLKLIMREYYPKLEDNAPPAVSIFGQQSWNIFELRAMMGIVTADLHQTFVARHGELTGMEVALSGFFASMTLYRDQIVTEAMRERADSLLRLLDAARLADQPIEHMSTGEARRVLIARALALDPDAMLLDEPTTGLDLLAARRFMDTMREVIRNGKTLILVTHRVGEIVPEVQRVVMLRGGKVFADEPKPKALTSARLTALYGAPIRVRRRDGYYSAVVE